MENTHLSFTLLEHSLSEIASKIQVLMKASYSVEGQRIGVKNFFPLFRTKENIQNSPALFFALLLEDKYVALTEIDTVSEGHLHIASFVVDPEFFRRGLGTTLLVRIQKYFGVAKYTVSTAILNLPAIQLYQSQGFKPYHYWKTPDGIDMVSLELLND